MAAKRFGDGDCSAFLRMAARVLARSLTLLREDIATRLSAKKKTAIHGGEETVMRLVLLNLERGRTDNHLEFERVGDWWIWVAIDGLMLRYGAASAKSMGKEQSFAIAMKFAKQECPKIDPVEFWAWAEVESIGNVWSFGEALDA